MSLDEFVAQHGGGSAGGESGPALLDRLMGRGEEAGGGGGWGGTGALRLGRREGAAWGVWRGVGGWMQGAHG